MTILNDTLAVKLDRTWSTQELKRVIELLMQRHESLAARSNGEAQGSVACIAASYVAKEYHPPKERLIRTIEAMNKEILSMPATAYVSDTEMESGPSSSSMSHTYESIECHGDDNRKRARLSCGAVLL